jgi:hypothetical protein
MDRLSELAADLTKILAELRDEADQHNLHQLAAPLAWLDEANGWLRYELARVYAAGEREPVPFTYIPVDLRR